MKKFWKVYSWLYLIMMISAVLYYISIGSVSDVVIDFFDNPLGHFLCYISWFIPVLGVFLYAYEKKFLHHFFWKLYFIYFIWGVLNIGIEVIENIKNGLIGIPLYFPFELIAVYALFKYAFIKK